MARGWRRWKAQAELAASDPLPHPAGEGQVGDGLAAAARLGRLEKGAVELHTAPPIQGWFAGRALCCLGFRGHTLQVFQVTVGSGY